MTIRTTFNENDMAANSYGNNGGNMKDDQGHHAPSQQLIEYQHKNDAHPSSPWFRQYEKDQLPVWAVNVRPSQSPPSERVAIGPNAGNLSQYPELTLPASPAATPRTEAMIDSCGDYEKAYHFNGRFAEFARGLERESAALRTEVEALKGRLARSQNEATGWKTIAEATGAKLEAAESALSAAKRDEWEKFSDTLDNQYLTNGVDVTSYRNLLVVIRALKEEA